MGIPFMAGFYSKDLILEWCLTSDLGVWMLILVTLGTFLTAFYSCRFLFLTMRSFGSISYSAFSQSRIALVCSSSLLGLGAIFRGFLFQEIFVDMNFFIYTCWILKGSVPVSVLLGIFVSL